MLKEHSNTIWIRNNEYEKIKSENQHMIVKKEEEATKNTLKRMAAELINVYYFTDSPLECFKQMVPHSEPALGSLSDKHAEAMLQNINSSLDKKYKVLVRTQDRPKFEQYIISSVSLLI